MTPEGIKNAWEKLEKVIEKCGKAGNDRIKDPLSSQRVFFISIFFIFGMYITLTTHYKEMTPFAERLRKALSGALPGHPGQALMAPSNRLRINRDIKLDSVLSSVLLCIYPYGDEWYICFMKRTRNLSVHSGQISFPGGKYERDDIIMAYTAIREAKEELNIDCNEKNIVGTLSSLFVPPSKSYIHPYVACLNEAPDFKPDPTEVDEIIEVSLNVLFDPLTKRKGYREINGEQVIIPYYSVDKHQIWGATAMILSEFEQILIKYKLLSKE